MDRDILAELDRARPVAVEAVETRVVALRRVDREEETTADAGCRDLQGGERHVHIPGLPAGEVAGLEATVLARAACSIALHQIHTPDRGVASVDRSRPRPLVRFEDGAEESFDQVILATHGPQAHDLLDAGAMQRDVLGAFRTSPNRAVLHSDPALMPKRRKVWSSWNFLTRRDAPADAPVSLTYWMNRLQNIDRKMPLFVSLNPERMPDADKVHSTHSYAHPVFDKAAFAAQAAIPAIQGRGGVWYAGAWLGYGFHEDGLRAGLAVAASLGATPAWAAKPPAPIRHPLAEAAE